MRATKTASHVAAAKSIVHNQGANRSLASSLRSLNGSSSSSIIFTHSSCSNHTHCGIRNHSTVSSFTAGNKTAASSTPLSFIVSWKQASLRQFHATSSTRKEEDLYETLGVPRTASADEIKRQYYKLAMQYHPDRNKGDKKAEEKLQKINAAYTVLKDEDKRRQYDQFGSAAFDGSGGGGFEGFDPNDIPVDMRDIFEGIFSGFGGGGGRRAKTKGDDVEVPLRINFHEAVNGCEKDISYMGKLPCPTCHGSGAAAGSKAKKCPRCNGQGIEQIAHGFIPIATQCRQCGGEGTIISDPCGTCKGQGIISGNRKIQVKIPAGVDDGANIRLVGQGDAGMKGGKPGNLFLRVHVSPDKVFKRDGVNVHTDIPVTLAQAVLGGTVKVPTLSGAEVEIKVPPGTQPEEKRVLRNQGVSAVGQPGTKGHHYIHFKVEIPTKLTPKQKELMEEWQKEEEQSGGIADKLKGYFKS